MPVALLRLLDSLFLGDVERCNACTYCIHMPGTGQHQVLDIVLVGQRSHSYGLSSKSGLVWRALGGVGRTSQ